MQYEKQKNKAPLRQRVARAFGTAAATGFLMAGAGTALSSHVHQEARQRIEQDEAHGKKPDMTVHDWVRLGIGRRFGEGRDPQSPHDSVMDLQNPHMSAGDVEYVVNSVDNLKKAGIGLIVVGGGGYFAARRRRDGEQALQPTGDDRQSHGE
jgi:hypothetical protein